MIDVITPYDHAFDSKWPLSYKAIFINVQHPGENSKPDEKPHSHWPATQKDPNNKTARPRSATVVITRKDGGVIAG